MNRSRTARTALLAALMVGLLLPAAAGAGPVVMDANQPAADVRDYWTQARMRHADPVPVEPVAAGADGPAPPAAAGPPTFVPPASPGGAGAAELLRGSASAQRAIAGRATEVTDPEARGVRAHGRVFFTVTRGRLPGNYSCSGTTVNSRNRSVVISAGHCVFDFEDGGGKVKNWLFVPAYRDGAAPFGSWPAKKLATTRQWKKLGYLHYDLGAAVVRRRGGQRLQKVVGARGIGFDQPRKQAYAIFGYPKDAPFTGEREYRCDSPNKGRDLPGGIGPKTIRAKCDMTRGSSGGGWIVGRTLLSVTSYGYTKDPGFLYGPYLSQTAKKLYKRVRGKRVRR